MTTIHLPSRLPGPLDMAATNRSLRAGTADLDWRAVAGADPGALEALLAGLSLAEHADALGLGSVPDGLAAAIQALCGAPEAAMPPTPAGQRAPIGAFQPVVAPSRGVQGRLGFAPPPPGLFDPQPSAVPDAGVPALERVDGPRAGGSRVSAPTAAAPQLAPEEAAAPLLGPPPPSAIRDELERAVLLDLLGPAGGPEEEVEEQVRDRYLVGLLAPKNNMAASAEDDDLAMGGADADEDGPTDQDIPLSQSLFPSSFGLTFSVAAATPELRVICRWGRYERTASERLTTEQGAPKQVWKRAPVETSLIIPLRETLRLQEEVDPESRGVLLQGVIRKMGGDWIVSLFLVNNQAEPPKLKSRAWLFQPELVAEAPDGAPVFRCRPRLARAQGEGGAEHAEEEALAMLYRRHGEFATGHGVSVDVTAALGRTDLAVRVATQVVPTYEVPQTAAPTTADNPDLAGLLLDMQALAERPAAEVVAGLRVLPAAYARWIEAREVEVADPAGGLGTYGDVPGAVLERCQRARARIAAGIDLLAGNEAAIAAFRFMNRAMWQQRIRTIYAETARRDGTADLAIIDVPANRSWRPFQIAFILMNLPALTELAHPERAPDAEATADLLWFPTGGGKTEAYLGLTAYTLGIRRLQGSVAGHDGEHGVAVLMRYTLRLLTLQQFQRAAALICACESIRREGLGRGDGRWGTVPFRIGLWVGQTTTPNSTEQSAEAIKKDHGNFRVGAVGGSGSPAQLTNCPWCGSPIDPGKDIQVEPFKGGRGRTLIYCGHPIGGCPFSRRQAPGEGLPVVVVDDEIYRLLPSLLIATVDKFARMPWRGATQMLFGRVTGYCPRHGFRSPDLEDVDSHPKQGLLEAVRTRPHPPLRPPDLIIQDELHLISGPLGAMVGLYETAVDRLASWEVDGRMVRPKVIASTATIRRAGEQVHALFLRRVAVFPPQGLVADDNFFSIQIPPDQGHPGRRYIGICAPGRRLKAALIRVYVAYLAASQQLYLKYGRAADPWMTLVGYFNSMRELGGMRRLVEDDVRSRLQHTDQHGLARRPAPRVEELTSRKSTTDIPKLLDRMEVVFDPAEEPARGRKGQPRTGISGGQPPLDVLLATNMVSVGVDIKRLGLMVVANQPKSTAEYIQATSRVGRTQPGLVCTVLNWARPRDLSHYEHFAHYHATFYQQVEALSVTPFAPRALDRGLASILVALVRLLEPELAGNAGAAKLLYEHPLIERAIAAIAARAVGADGEQIRARVMHDLRRLVDTWIAQARDTTGGQTLGYRPNKDGVTRALLSAPDLGEWLPFTCLMSLRDVEPEVGLMLDNRNLDEEREWEAAQGGPLGTEEVGA